MILTKEQEDAIVKKYAEKTLNADRCIGFIDGMSATIEFINDWERELMGLTKEEYANYPRKGYVKRK